MNTTLYTHIKGLVVPSVPHQGSLKGADLSKINILQDAWLLMQEGKIHSYGTMNQVPTGNFETENLQGRYVLPGYCDSHTHLVFHQSRESEFVMRIQGKSYEEIAAAGGGILNSAEKLGKATEQELFDQALFRLHQISKLGTTAVEIKSGYGLNTENELKMLRVIRRLKEQNICTIKSTFLGAHAFPKEYKENKEAYVDLLIHETLPQVAGQNLADFIDVFCDRGFFSPQQTDRILEAGAKYGLKPKIHANELDYSGGIQSGVRNHAVSVDHLEFTGKEEIEVLSQSNTLATLLPSTAFFLGLHYPPARTIIDSGLAVSLASDYNPGSSPSGNMNFIWSLACVKLKMLPTEALNALTYNAAYAMEIADKEGSIEIGKKANLIITDKISSLDFIPYSFGNTHIYKTIIDGRTV